MKCILTFLTVLLVSCRTTKETGIANQDFEKALQESTVIVKPDFLTDEKLPNEEYILSDTMVAAVSIAEVLPREWAPYRIQVFAGTADNAHKTHRDFSSRGGVHSSYLVRDSADGLWKVWIGGLQTRVAADSLKAELIGLGYTGAWIKESPTSTENKLWYVQVGSFQNQAAAEKTRDRLAAQTVVIREVKGLWKVWVGGFPDRAQADELKRSLTGFSGTFVVQDSE